MNVNPKLNEIDSCLYRVAVKAIIHDDRHNILLGLEDNGYWSFPGGGIDHGEDEITALYRKLYEELGIKKNDIKVNNYKIHIDTGHIQKGIPKVNIFYLVKLKSVNFILNEEISEIKWVDISTLNTIKLSKSIGDINKIISFIRNSQE